VKRAIKNADIRPDPDPVDLLRALIGVSNVASGPDWVQSARRLVDILILGSRPVVPNTQGQQKNLNRKASAHTERQGHKKQKI